MNVAPEVLQAGATDRASPATKRSQVLDPKRFC